MNFTKARRPDVARPAAESVDPVASDRGGGETTGIDRTGYDFGGLPDALVRDLADLYSIPSTAVDAILQMLPFGYRAALEGLGYVEAAATAVGRQPVRLTDRGCELIAQAHSCVHRGLEAQGQPDLADLRAELLASVNRIQQRT